MDPIISFNNVSFQYPDKNFSMQDLNFSILSGKKYAICGQNGSGKTTLLRLIMGLETAATGIIIVNGVRMDKKSIKYIRNNLGFVFQNPDSQVFSASVYEDVAFGPRNLGLPPEQIKDRVHEALEKVDMIEYSDRSPYLLSYGQKKRIAIAGVLAMNPFIIVLDEPFSNLDYPSRTSLMQILDLEVQKQGKTVIFATHSRKYIEEWSDYALFLDKGHLIFIGKQSELNMFPLTNTLLGP